jgi:hypothetical protein
MPDSNADALLTLSASYTHYAYRYGYGSSHSFALVLVGLGLVVLVWVLLLNWDYLVETIKLPTEQIDPLLEELGLIHRLNRSEMTILQNAADHLKLETAADLFVDSSLWTPTEETPFFSHPKMQRIHRLLFGENESAVV